MYAIVKTGGKQYKVCAGDFLNVEKLDGKVGDKVSLEVIFVSDGGKVVADPKKAAATKVEAEIVEQFKDKKVIVFKFKKRKNYQRKVGHRQQLTRIRVLCVGDEVAKEEKKPAKKAAKKTTKESTKETSDSKAKATPAKKASAPKAKEEKADKAAEDEKPKKTAAKPKKDSDAATKKAPAKKEAPKDDADDKDAKKEETDAEKAE